MPARVTAASAPLKLKDRTGKETTFRFSPLMDIDYDELDEWVQTKLIDIARRSLPITASREERDEVTQMAIREASSVCWNNGAGTRVLATTAGQRRLLWQSLRREHPQITEDELSPFVRIRDNVNAILDLFARVNFPERFAEQPPDPTTPAPSGPDAGAIESQATAASSPEPKSA